MLIVQSNVSHQKILKLKNDEEATDKMPKKNNLKKQKQLKESRNEKYSNPFYQGLETQINIYQKTGFGPWVQNRFKVQSNKLPINEVQTDDCEHKINRKPHKRKSISIKKLENQKIENNCLFPKIEFKQTETPNLLKSSSLSLNLENKTKIILQNSRKVQMVSLKKLQHSRLDLIRNINNARSQMLEYHKDIKKNLFKMSSCLQNVLSQKRLKKNKGLMVVGSTSYRNLLNMVDQ